MADARAVAMSASVASSVRCRSLTWLNEPRYVAVLLAIDEFNEGFVGQLVAARCFGWYLFLDHIDVVGILFFSSLARSSSASNVALSNGVSLFQIVFCCLWRAALLRRCCL